MDRPARDKTSYSKDFYFSDVSIGSYPWCGGHSGNATSLLPYDHGRLAHDETPYPPFVEKNKIVRTLFLDASIRSYH